MASSKKRLREDDNGEVTNPKKAQNLTSHFDTDYMTPHQAKMFAQEYADNTFQIYSSGIYAKFVKLWDKLLAAQKIVVAEPAPDSDAFFDAIKPKVFGDKGIRFAVTINDNPFTGKVLSGSVFSQIAPLYIPVLEICCQYFEVSFVADAERRVLLKSLSSFASSEEVWNLLCQTYGDVHLPHYGVLLSEFKKVALKRIGKATRASNFAKPLEELLDVYLRTNDYENCKKWVDALKANIQALRRDCFDTNEKLLENLAESPSQILEKIVNKALSQPVLPIFKDDTNSTSLAFKTQWIRVSLY